MRSYEPLLRSRLVMKKLHSTARTLILGTRASAARRAPLKLAAPAIDAVERAAHAAGASRHCLYISPPRERSWEFRAHRALSPARGLISLAQSNWLVKFRGHAARIERIRERQLCSSASLIRLGTGTKDARERGARVRWHLSLVPSCRVEAKCLLALARFSSVRPWLLEFSVEWRIMFWRRIDFKLCCVELITGILRRASNFNKKCLYSSKCKEMSNYVRTCARKGNLTNGRNLSDTAADSGKSLHFSLADEQRYNALAYSKVIGSQR